MCDLLCDVSNVIDDSIELILRQPEKHISFDFCHQLLTDEIPLEKDLFKDFETFEEHNYFEKVSEINAIGVDKSNFQLKATLIKRKKRKKKKLKQLSKLTLDFGFTKNVERDEQSNKETETVNCSLCNKYKQSKEHLCKYRRYSRVESEREREEEIRSMLSMETGLNRGLIPSRIIALQEYKGLILHLVEWTDANEEMEVIPSPVLSAKYPQVVIDFYESMAVMCDLLTGEEQKIHF